jgi:bifunctional non-homologous end joining protein LigD
MATKSALIHLPKVNGVKKLERYYKPMLASLGDHAFDDADWLFEIKWDGYRAVTEWKKGKLKLYSRNGLSFLNKYPIVAQALTALKHDVVLDGEIVVMDESGKPSFQKLQDYERNPRFPIAYYVFDILFLHGKDLRDMPLTNRKELLQKLLAPLKGNIIRYCDHVEGQGKKFFKHMVKMDFEGMIAKKKDSSYYSGVRTNEWLKIKHHNEIETVITGFTEPRGSRKYFGALILGAYDKGRLRYIGHTGTGFTQERLKDLWLQMQSLIIHQSPFNEKVKVNTPVTWIRPELVCQIKFTEQTNDGILRHPVYLGLRDDKSAREVKL